MLELDISVFQFLHHAFSGGWLVPMAVLSAIGGGWGSLTVIPLVLANRTRRFATSLAAVLGVTAVLVFVLKRVFARVRPCNCLPGMKTLVFDAPSDFSFPSGHAAGSFAFTVFLAIAVVRATPADATTRERWLRRAAAAFAVLLASGVGLSRIALGVHFPGDVLAGASLGTVIAVVGAGFHHGTARGSKEEMSRTVQGS